MKKIIAGLLAGLAMTGMAAAASTVPATPSTHHIYVDGRPVNLAVYEIEDNNYFKLRDLAALVNGTDKQFSVDWSEESQCIFLRTDMPYQPVGGELTGTTAAQQAKPGANRVYIDALPTPLSAYEIAGNNYFKLRDLAAALDIGIGWDEAAQRVDISTTQGYIQPDRQDLMPVDYLGMTIAELGDLWGRDITYLDYWYSGNAKGIYYDDQRVPLLFYYDDANFTGHAQGQEPIILVSFSPQSFPQGREITPGLSMHATYVDLRAKGYPNELHTDPDEMNGENSATAYCTILIPDATVYFYWFENADPYTMPADLVELFAF